MLTLGEGGNVDRTLADRFKCRSYPKRTVTSTTGQKPSMRGLGYAAPVNYLKYNENGATLHYFIMYGVVRLQFVYMHTYQQVHKSRNGWEGGLFWRALI